MQVLISCDSDTTLWRLSGRERLRRQFARLAGVTLLADPAQCRQDAPLLLIRGDYVFTPSLIEALRGQAGEFALTDEGGSVIALRLFSCASIQAIVARLNNGAAPAGMIAIPAQQLATPYDAALRKHAAAGVHKISVQGQARLENILFASAYKGVTDAITRFVWPRPARWATRCCARHGITPNQLTVFSLLLVIASGLLFWHGWFLTGLLLAWVMTFLDTVDGKLARVTISASPAGHLLDHGMDIIHPPLWYYAWGLGLVNLGLLGSESESEPVGAFAALMWAMLIAYAGGRLLEGLFELLAPVTLFTWRRFDSFHRLITARRNPNLVLLTVFALAGQPAPGLYAVISWHLLCTTVLLVRSGQFLYQRSRGRPLDSWLADITPGDKDLAVRLFCNPVITE